MSTPKHLDKILKPFQEKSEFSKLDKCFEQVSIIFPSNNSPSKVVQPGYSAFDNPASAVAPEFSSVWRRPTFSVFSFRGDQVNTTFGHAGTQGIAVGSFVVDQKLWRMYCAVYQPFNNFDLVGVYSLDFDGKRKASPIYKEHEFVPLPRRIGPI